MSTKLLKKYEITNKPNDTKEWLYINPKFDINYDKDKNVKAECIKLAELNSRMEKLKEYSSNYQTQINSLQDEKQLLLKSQIDMDFEDYNDKSLELTRKIEDLKFKVTSNHLLITEIEAKTKDIEDSILNAKSEVREKIHQDQIEQGKLEVIEFLQTLQTLQDKLEPILVRMHNISRIKGYEYGTSETLFRLIRVWNDNTDNFDYSMNELKRKFEINENEYINKPKGK